MNNFIESLGARIRERIKVRGYCVIYDNDLSQLAQPPARVRLKQIHEIQRFAEANGLAVTIRDSGLNATFTDPASLAKKNEAEKLT